MQLLIPSAKTIPPELQQIGKIPTILYPINKDIVLDYLIDLYKHKIDDIFIVGYEKIDLIAHRLNQYRLHNVNLITLDHIADLGYTIYYGIRRCKDEPVIINFADTIVEDVVDGIDNDSFYYAEDNISAKWTFFENENGVLKHISDKCEMEIASNKTGKLFVGVFIIAHKKDFEQCLEQALQKREDMDSFYTALQLYSKIYPFKPIKTNHWFDIGHADNYFNSKLKVAAREFNHIRIDKERGILYKTSDDVDKFIGEIEWYLKLPTDVAYVRPRIFSYSISYTNPYVEMEYYSYHTVHDLYLFGDLSYSQWKNIFGHIKFICQDFSRYKVYDSNINKAMEDMYLIKTIKRMIKLKKDDHFLAFFNKPFLVNGIKYISLNQIMEILRKVIPERLYNIDSFQIIHGDLCFANIMIDDNQNFVKLIDPRGRFGKFDIYGDYRYDLAKLWHSVDGKYDFIIKDMFAIDFDTDLGIINYSIFKQKQNFDMYQCLLDSFADQIEGRLDQIELIEALLFLSMIPLHGESINQQMAMLGTGVEILNRVVNIKA
jgi:choline kinase